MIQNQLILAYLLHVVPIHSAIAVLIVIWLSALACPLSLEGPRIADLSARWTPIALQIWDVWIRNALILVLDLVVSMQIVWLLLIFQFVHVSTGIPATPLYSVNSINVRTHSMVFQWNMLNQGFSSDIFTTWRNSLHQKSVWCQCCL